jgi:hypothetical protein
MTGKYLGWGDTEAKDESSAPTGATMRHLRSLNFPPPQTINQPATSPVIAEENRLPAASSQPTEQPRGGPVSNQPAAGSQPVVNRQPAAGNQVNASKLSLLAALPEQKGETRIPNRYTDHLCRMLRPDEQAVYWQLYRLSWGWGKETCLVSNPKLSERSNVPLSTMKRAVASLVEKGVIIKTGQTNGYGKEQGVEYRLPSLGSQPALSRQPVLSSQPGVDSIKETHIKEHTQTTAGVRVCSRFSLPECQRYAEHLRSSGQGITNPGGYATKIHRSGEADELIASFLIPAEAAPSVDVSKCPDCRGTGWKYPDGVDKGAARCRHDKLT